MTKINYIPASHGQVQPTKLAIRLFFYSYSGGRLRWFACFSSFSLPIVPNSGGGLWWFAMVCGGLSYSHTHSAVHWICTIALRNLWIHTLRRNPWIAQESMDRAEICSVVTIPDFAMRYVSRYLGHDAIRIAILVYRVSQSLDLQFVYDGSAI